jgi:hypothetical protein
VLAGHQAACLLQPQPLLKLQRAHCGDRLELVVETRHAPFRPVAAAVMT